MTLEERFETLLKHPLATRVGFDHLQIYRPRYERMYKTIRQLLPKPSGAALDVGCGFGVSLALLDDLGFKELIGIDLFTKKEESFLADVPRARFVAGDLEADALSQIPDESVECVVSSQVLEHLLNYPFGHLEECFRALRPGGVFFLDIPNPCTAANMWRMLRGRFEIWGDAEFARTRKLGADYRLATTWSIHYREYPPHVLRDLVQSLPGCRVRGAGFCGTNAGPSDRFSIRAMKHCVRALGLRDRRLFGNVQWIAMTKEPLA